MSNIFTFSPLVRFITQSLSNRDFAGRQIIQTGSPLYKKAGQAAEYAASNLVAPYGTFGPSFQPGSSKGGPLHELLSQVFDVRVPTAEQVKGAQYGRMLAEREARTRARKPRGLIEAGIERISPAQAYQEGGLVVKPEDEETEQHASHEVWSGGPPHIRMRDAVTIPMPQGKYPVKGFNWLPGPGEESYPDYYHRTHPETVYARGGPVRRIGQRL